MHQRRFTGILVVAIVLALCASVSAADREVEYQRSLAQFFDVPEAVCTDLLATGMVKDEVPVVLFIANRTKMKPERIAHLRARGDSWMGIAKSRNLSPQDFYVIVVGDIPSKTYGPIFTKFKTTPIMKWNKIELTDADIINLVNLKYIGSHYDYSVFEIMALRDAGQNFMDINHEVGLLKAKWVEEQRQKERNSLVSQKGTTN